MLESETPAAYAVAMRETLAAFRELSPDTVDEFEQFTISQRLEDGEVLFETGTPYLEKVFSISAGEIELSRAGAPAVRLGVGDVLGLDNYFHGSAYQSTAKAVGQVEINVISADVLQQIEQRHPELFLAINRQLTTRLRARTTERQPTTGVWALPARSFMKTPLSSCSEDTTVAEAFELMAERGIGSLGVLNAIGDIKGLLTYTSLAHGFVSQDVKPDDPVSEGAWEEVHTIAPHLPLWKVRAEQQRLGVKYLVVCVRDRPAGVISQTDILQVLVAHQQSVIAEIKASSSFLELSAYGTRLTGIAKQILQNNRDARMAVRALSEVHLAIQRRCVDLVLEEMKSDGLGPPPVPYALLVMGSGGRKEMMINPDQDNAIVIANSSKTDLPETKAWFEGFCERVNTRLDEVGYDWCKGNIMARNPEYHRTLSEWRAQITRITERPTERAARWSTIFFDLDTLYGDDGLTTELRRHVLQEIKTRPRLLTLMVEDDATGRPAVGLFNRLVTASDKKRKGKVDLKRNGTRILADAARVYALSEGISTVNTGDRVRALVNRGRLSTDFANSVLAALDEMLDITLDHQIKQVEAGAPLDKLIDPERLQAVELESLRIAMRVTKTFQGRMQGEFGTVLL